MIKKFAILSIFIASFFGVGGSAVFAADPDPPIVLSEAQAFQCLLTTTATTTADCDLLVLARFELPKEDWRSDTGGVGDYMEEFTCVDGDENNFIDLCYTSLKSGMVTFAFYSGPHATAQLEGVRNMPRVGHGVVALYEGAGHGLTFSDATYEVCIEPSVTIFTPATQKCTTLNWNAVTDVDGDGELFDDAKDINAAAIQSIAINLDTASPGRNELITTNTLIGPVGAVFFDEAFSGWSIAAPSAFAIGSESIGDVNLSLTPTAAETTIETEAQASNLWGYVNDFSVNHMGGANIHLVGGALIGAIAVIIFMFIWAWLKSAFIAGVIAVLFMFGGALQDFIDINMLLAVILLIFGIGIFTFARNKLSG